MAAALGTLFNKIRQIGSHSPDEPKKEVANAFLHDQTTGRSQPNLRSTKRSLSPHQLEDTLLQKPLPKKQKISEEEKRLVLPRTNHIPKPASSYPVAISTSKWTTRPTTPARMTRKVAARGAVTPMNTLSRPTFQSTKNQPAPHSRPTMPLETERVTGDNVAGFRTSSVTTNSPSTKRQKLDHTSYFPDHGGPNFGHDTLEPLSRPTQPDRKPSSISIDSQDSFTRSKEEPFRANEARHVDRMLVHKRPRKPKSTSASSSQAERIIPDSIDLDSKPPPDSMQMKPPAKRGSTFATDNDVAVIIERPAVGTNSPRKRGIDQTPSEQPSPVIHIQSAYDALNPGNHPAKSQNRTPMRDKLSRDTFTDTKPTPLSRPSLRKSMQVSSSEPADRRRAAEGSEDELAIPNADKPRAVKSVRPTSPTATRSTQRKPQVRQKEDGVQNHEEEVEDGNTFKLSSIFTLSAQITDEDLTLSFLPSKRCFVPMQGGAPVLASHLYQNHAQTVVANPVQSLRLGMIGSKDSVTGGEVWFEFCSRRELEICLARLSWLKNNGVAREVDSNKYSRNGIEHQFQAALKKFDFERQRNAAKEMKSDATQSRQVAQELSSTTITREQAQDALISTSRPYSHTLGTPKTPRVKAMQSDYSERSPRAEIQSSPAAEKASLSSLRSTRTSRRLQAKDTVEKPREPELERWTRNNPPLKWDSPLVYPASGPKRTTVEATDVERLDNGEFLNDNIISFCLRHLEEGHPELKDKVHIFNTFFYTSLSTKQGKKLFNYDAVKRWTKNIDIFSYPFVVVPVNANLHWFVTIICNLDKLGRKLGDDGEHEEANDVDNEHDMLDNTISGVGPAGNGLPMELPDSQEEPATEAITMEVDKLSLSGSEKQETGIKQVDDNGIVFEFSGSPEPPKQSANQKSAPARKGKKKAPPPIPKLNPNQTAIITLDSLGGTHSVEVRNLKDYVVHEGQEKRGMTIAREDIKGLLAKGIPEQTNFCDCGVYLVGYITEFLKDPTEFVRKVMSREIDRNNDFADFDPVKKREEIRNDLLRLEEEQREAKRERKRAQRGAKRMALGQLDGTSESPASGRDNSNDAATPATRSSPEGDQCAAPEQDTKEAKEGPTAASNEGEAHPPDSQPVVLSHREKRQSDNGGVQVWAEVQEAAQE